ncbi:hypothetical protein [Catenulispora rubra]|uniref:hypothetical protein n=1 Tax=Catenulispora rubra TaxID=280293 RepID=UPI001892346F|nr:hypothetical protein [Catenulispora rubra]
MPPFARARIRIVFRDALVASVALVAAAALIGTTGTAQADVSAAPAHRLMAACVCWG